MGADQTTVNSIFFNHSFDKKRLKALISWVFKQSGEAEALKVIDLLKETGFRHATKAGISIGLHDLATPVQKSWLISESQVAMNTTERDFAGARITAAERSQRIIDTWHRASESLSKQVVDYFGVYDKFNPVYIMALSGARGNFSQVRQLIGMRGLMADQQGKIVNFPIRSNLREGLTLTEYFISCSGARKGLVDTALRTADTGYLTRRLVDVSHHVVVKRIRCNTNRGIAFKSLQSYNKTLLPLKERLVGRVLAEDVFSTSRWGEAPKEQSFVYHTTTRQEVKNKRHLFKSPHMIVLAKKDQEISLQLALKVAEVRNKVDLRSPLTCGFTQSVCQLCYGWSISQGSLVSLGDAVGVIAAQSIGEPGTQLTMRTFHTGGVFSGDLLQEIKAPHKGIIEFSKAFQGLLIRTAHGRVAFLSKTEGSLVVKGKILPCRGSQNQHTFTTIPIPAFTILFVRQGEKVENNQLLAEFSIRTREGNQPIKTEQTIFAELSGRVVEDCTGKVYTKSIKESALFLDFLKSDDSSFFSDQDLLPLSKKRLVRRFEMQEELLGNGSPKVQPEIVNKTVYQQKPETTLFRNSFLAYKANLFLSSFATSKSYVTQVISSFSSYNGRISAQKSNGQGVSFQFLSNKSSCSRALSANEGSKASLSMFLGVSQNICPFSQRFARRFSVPAPQSLRLTSANLGVWVLGFGAKPHRSPIKALYKSKICNACTLSEAHHKSSICMQSSKHLPLLQIEDLYAKICKKICMRSFISPFYKSLLCYELRSKQRFAIRFDRLRLTNRRFSEACDERSSTASMGQSPKTQTQSKALHLDLRTGLRFICDQGGDTMSFKKVLHHSYKKKVYSKTKNVLYKSMMMYCARLDQSYRKKNALSSDSYKHVFEQKRRSFVHPRANLFFTKKPVEGFEQQEVQKERYPQAKIKMLNLVQGVQKKTLQNIFDIKLGRLGTSHNGKRFVFLNEMKKKQFPRCKAQILFLQKSEDLESDTFKYIEPVRSGRLGFLKILSMRVGATLDYRSPLIVSDQSKKNKKSMSIKGYNEINSNSERFMEENVSFLKKTDKYLHPEVVKENRFFLQTIAKHGDIVEEGYSYNS